MKKRLFSIIGLLLIFAMLCTACGSSYKSSYNGAYAESSSASYAEAKESGYREEPIAEEGYWDEDMEMEAAAEEPMEEPSSGEAAYTAEQDNNGTATTLSNDKLVYTCNLEIETTEYQKTVQAIREKIRKYNAIIEYESETDNDRKWYYSGHVKNTGTMYLNMTIRVPVAQYDAFVTDAGDFGKVTSKSQNVENISRQYHSTEARIEALEKEEKRLNEMMDKAETIEEMIYIEERLTDVEAELNIKKTNLASMDVDVAYSTVNLYVTEVLIYTEPDRPTITFGQRIAQAFRDSWEGFTGFLEGLLIVIIHLLPFIICGMIIAVVIIILNKRADKKNPERKARRIEKAAQRKAEKERKKAMKRGYFPPRPPVAPTAVNDEKANKTEKPEEK